MNILNNQIDIDKENSTINLEYYKKTIKEFIGDGRVSLSSLLKNQELNNLLNQLIKFPKFEKKEIIINRDDNVKGFETYIGMSYDYLIRFLLDFQQNNSMANSLTNSIGFRLSDNKRELIRKLEGNENKIIELIKLSFELSLIETSFRTGNSVRSINSFDKNKLQFVYEDIFKNAKITLPEIKKHKDSKIIYNPIFAYKNIAADGDILINNRLIDFKVVSSLSYSKEHIKQLVLYSVLNHLNKKEEIKEIQLYIPRFDYYPVFKLKDLINSDNFKKLVNIIK